jgi:hypothetical protein
VVIGTDCIGSCKSSYCNKKTDDVLSIVMGKIGDVKYNIFNGQDRGCSDYNNEQDRRFSMYIVNCIPAS